MSYLRRIRIFRRLFIALAIMALVPTILGAVLSSFFLSSLQARSQAVQVSIDAQSTASDGLNNLQRMNALLQTRFTQIFAIASGKEYDVSLQNASGLISTDILARELDFSLTLTSFQGSYEVASSPDMAAIKAILLSDSPATGPTIINDQQQAVEQVTGEGGLWVQYQTLQDQEMQVLNLLDPGMALQPPTLTPEQLKTTYQQDYAILWQANFVYLDLRNTWQRVVTD